MDVSFISLGLIFPALRPLLADNANLVCLIKPQFEAGKDKVGKKGVVRDANVHLAVLEQFLRHAAENDLTVQGMTYSPIKGPGGQHRVPGLAHRCGGREPRSRSAYPGRNIT